MLELIKRAVTEFKSTTGSVRILTHHDTGGITSGAIIAKAIQREDRGFRISVLKQVDRELVSTLKSEKNDIIFFLDFGSSALDELAGLESKVIILDNHEISGIAPSNVLLVNPHTLPDKEQINSSALSFLFAKELNPANCDMGELAVLGMVGDYGDLSNLGSLAQSVISNCEDVVVKKSLMLFPATRPIHKALEFSSKVYIPGVTGASEGVLGLLNEAKIPLKYEGEYRTLLDLNSEETKRLVDSISARTADAESIKNAFGFIYLIKFFSHLEDARELSMQINACGKLGHGDLAIAFCMGSKKAKFFAESIYITYKHMLLSGLKWVSTHDKIEGDGYVIVNAGSEIKDTIMGTVLSILAASYTYAPGTVLIGMTNTEDKRLKISSRITGKGRKDINLQRVLEPLAKAVGGEAGGHQTAAGGIIPLEKQEEFLSLLQKELGMRNVEVETINS